MFNRADLREQYQALEKMELKYNLSTEPIREMMEEMNHFKVTLPVIGNFSTGKSSMLNAIMEKELLPVAITPETAVPTELYYGNNKVYQYMGDQIKEHNVNELPLRGLSIRDTDVVKIEYNDPFLKEISSVKVVDLPGFDSNIGLHNMAIEQYLPNSLAYFLVISSDEPVLKASMTNFLKVLKLHDMPVYVVLTKTARLLSSELEECKELIRTTVKNIFEIENVKVACVESYGDLCVDEVKEFLLEVQKNSSSIFKKRYSEILRKFAKTMEIYLIGCLEKKDLSTSQLEEQKEDLEKNIARLLSKVDREQELFDKQTNECIEVIKKRVQLDLEDASEAITVFIQNGEPINEKIGTIVQHTVIECIKKEFEPKLQKYLKNINEVIAFENLCGESISIETSDLVTESKVQGILLKLAPVVFAALGVIGGPVGVIVGAIIGIFTDTAFNLTNVKIKERKAKEATAEIIKTVSEQVGISVSEELKAYVKNVNTMIEKEIENQNNVLQKSLVDVKKLLELEGEASEKDMEGLVRDLETVREWMTTV